MERLPMRGIFCISFVFFLSLIPSTYSDTNDNAYVLDSWDTKKLLIDFINQYRQLDEDYEKKSILVYGDTCSYESEIQRVNLTNTMVNTLLEFQNPETNIVGLLKSIEPSVKEYGELQGLFCSTKKYYLCSEFGKCICANNPRVHQYLIYDEDGFCRQRPGARCGIVNIYDKGRLKERRTKNITTEARKCSIGTTCIIKENGKKCSKRNIRREFKKIIQMVDSEEEMEDKRITQEKQKAAEDELVKRIIQEDYCICGGTGLKMSPALLSTVVFIITIGLAEN